MWGTETRPLTPDPGVKAWLHVSLLTLDSVSSLCVLTFRICKMETQQYPLRGIVLY